MSKEENITRSKQNSPNQNGFDESMELGDSSKIATMSPPPFQLMASPASSPEKIESVDSTTKDGAHDTIQVVSETESSEDADPKPRRLRMRGKQKRYQKKGRRQLANGVENGEYYFGDKTAAGFGEGGKDPNLGKNFERHPVDPLVPQTATLEHEMHDEPRVIDWNMPVDPGVDALESRTPSMELREIREGRTVTMPAPTRPSGPPPPTPMPFASGWNPWNAISGAISDLDGSLATYLNNVVTRANSLPFTQITIQADYMPSNWETFNPFLDVVQRSDLQGSSIIAANNIAARLRALGLRPGITVRVLNNWSNPSTTVANGIRFGAGAPSRPSINLILR